MRFSDLFGSPPKQPVQPTPPVRAVAELESRIDRICRALGIDAERIAARASDTNALPLEIMEEISAGRKIQAIKLYRDLTGCDLKTAKETIEAAEAGAPPTGSRFLLLQAKLDAILAQVESDR